MECEHCGYTSLDTTEFMSDFGPVFCRDREACWNRWLEAMPPAVENFKRTVFELRALIVPVEGDDDECS